MSIEKQVMSEIKQAMLDKDKIRLEAFRAVKNEFIKLKTSGQGVTEISDVDGIKLIQKLVKQRKESAQIFKTQSREDLYDKEMAEAEAMSIFLPKMLTEDEIRAEVKAVIEQLGASSMADMGKVMGASAKKLAGKADNSIVSKIVKELLA
jgi:uncharacterized protein YqeY